MAALVCKHGYTTLAPHTTENDVLSRFWRASRQVNRFRLPVVRVTGDCPLIDPEVIDNLIELFYSKPGLAYASLGSEWADGLDAEIFSATALNQAYQSTEGADREHVTPYIWKHPNMFPQTTLPCPLDLSEERWCVDTAEDLNFVRCIYDFCYHRNPFFGWRDVYAYIQYSNLNSHFLNRERRNQGYLQQVGVTDSWESVRFGG